MSNPSSSPMATALATPRPAPVHKARVRLLRWTNASHHGVF